MCQGHEEATPKKDSNASTSGQPFQSNQRKKEWKKQQKKEKEQSAKAQAPPSTSPAPPQPTHEIVKSRSTAIANGTRYIDVTTLLFLKSKDRLIVILS